jgi:HD-like signal output (HDOD) protein
LRIWDWLLDCITGQSGNLPKGGSTVATLEPPLSGEPPAPDETEPTWWAPEGARLTEPEFIPRPELSTEARALENLLISHFDGHNLDLPPLARVPERVLQYLRDRDCDFGRIAECIAEDQVIAAAVMRMANSPLYRGLERIASLRLAIARLGTKALQALMFNQSLRVATGGRKGPARMLAEIIWKRSLASATIMRGLSGFVPTDGEEAFLLGLLHDIGNVIVLREARKQRRYLDFELDIETFEYLCFECHQEFGELIAKAWSLPAKLQTLVTDHHRYPEPDDALRTERLLLQITDMACALLGYSPPAPYDLLSARAVRDLNLATHGDFLMFLCRLPSEVEDTIACM